MPGLRANQLPMQNSGADIQKIKTMTPSPPDVQNVPDVWGLLEQARDFLFDAYPMETRRSKEWVDIGQSIDAALAQRERFVLVPIKAPASMLTPYLTIEQWRLMLAAAPKPKGKP
jgi:hypothetical protein